MWFVDITYGCGYLGVALTSQIVRMSRFFLDPPLADIEIPGWHEIIQKAHVRNPMINESILEPNYNLAEKGVFVASVLVGPKEHKKSRYKSLTQGQIQ